LWCAFLPFGWNDNSGGVFLCFVVGCGFLTADSSALLRNDNSCGAVLRFVVGCGFDLLLGLVVFHPSAYGAERWGT
jgi:hypothetical protein